MAGGQKIQRRGAMDFLKSAQPDGRKSMFINLDDIRPDPDQPRTRFRMLDGQVDDESQEMLEKLAASIAAENLIQPITVRQDPEYGPGKWMIVAGERRWRATLLNRAKGIPNSDTIEALEKEVKNEGDMVRVRSMQLSENIKSQNLTDLEIAAHMQRMLKEYPELQQKDLTEIFNESKQWVSRMLGLLDPRFSELVNSGMITYSAIMMGFKTLSEDGQKKVVQEAKAAGKGKVTSGMIKRQRDAERGEKELPSNQPPAAPSMAHSAPPSSLPPSAPAQAPLRIGTVQQEVRLQLAQLVDLLPFLDTSEPIPVAVTLDVKAMRETIRKLGVEPSRDNLKLTNQLIEVLNSKRRRKK